MPNDLRTEWVAKNIPTTKPTAVDMTHRNAIKRHNIERSFLLFCFRLMLLTQKVEVIMRGYRLRPHGYRG